MWESIFLIKLLDQEECWGKRCVAICFCHAFWTSNPGLVCAKGLSVVFELVRFLFLFQTRILVTHSISFLPQVDQIVVLQDGRISEVSSVVPVVLTTWLPAQQPISIQKAQSRKKSPQTFAHFVNLSKMCLPCLIIMQSCYFDYTIDTPLACSRCVICVSCCVHLISTYYVRKGLWAFYRN